MGDASLTYRANLLIVSATNCRDPYDARSYRHFTVSPDLYGSCVDSAPPTVGACSSSLEYFSMVTRDSQSLANLGGHLTQRAEDILLTRYLRLLVGKDVARRAVRGA